MGKISKKNSKEWWKERYNQNFVGYFLSHLDASSKSLTEMEVDSLLSFLNPIMQANESFQVLDVGGGFGRHAISLALKSPANITVFDQSKPFLAVGAFLTATLGLAERIHFIYGDVLHLQKYIGTTTYKVILCLGNSILGYFKDEKDDLVFLKNLFSALDKNGILILDIQNAEYLQDRFKKTNIETKNLNGFTVITKRTVFGRKIKMQEKILEGKRLVSIDNIAIRLYEHDHLLALLKNTGFSDVQNHHDCSRRLDLGTMSSRLFYVCVKRGERKLPRPYATNPLCK